MSALLTNWLEWTPGKLGRWTAGQRICADCEFTNLGRRYQRKAIPNSQLCHLDGSLIELNPSDTVWVYAQPDSAGDAGESAGNGRACVECPIIQSYLDIVIHGALEVRRSC